MKIPSASGLQNTESYKFGTLPDLRKDSLEIFGYPYTFRGDVRDYINTNLKGGNFNPTEYKEMARIHKRSDLPPFLSHLPYGREAFNRTYKHHHISLPTEKN